MLFTGLTLVARLAVGPAGVGLLVGVGRAPRHHRAALLPLPRLPRAAPHPAVTRSGAAKRNAIAALIAFVDVPIVHFSVEWWRTLHQKATVFNPQLNPKIHGVMGLTLWIGTIAFTLVYVYLLDRRYRLAVLEEGAARPRARARRSPSAPARPSRRREVGGRRSVTRRAATSSRRGASPPSCSAATRSGSTRRVRRAERERVRAGARRVTAPARPCAVAHPLHRGRGASAVAVVVIAIVLLVVLADNVVFFRTVSEAVKERSSQGTSRFRLAGAVVPGTVDGDRARRRLRGHRRQADRARRAPGRPARAVQGRGARSCARATGRVGSTVRLATGS